MPRDDATRWMWPEACAMLARAERLHHQLFHVAAGSSHQTVWEPPVDVLETISHVVVVVGLPGVEPDSVRLEIEDHELRIAATRSLPAYLGRVFVHRMELPLGRFERNVMLPRGRYGDMRSASADGCLIVTLSKVF